VIRQFLLLSMSDTTVFVTSVFKMSLFYINICCFRITVCVIFITKTLHRPVVKLTSYFSMSKMAAGRHLALSETKSFTVRLAVPENPTPEPEIASIGQPDLK